MTETKEMIEIAKKKAELAKKLEKAKRKLEGNVKDLEEAISQGKSIGTKNIDVKYSANNVERISKELDRLK